MPRTQGRHIAGLGVVGDQQHRHQDRGDETGQGPNPDPRVAKIAPLRQFNRRGARRKRGDDGVNNHQQRRAGIVRPTPAPRAMMKCRTIAPIVVPRNPARSATVKAPSEKPPAARPVSAPTAVPTIKTINKLAEVISYSPLLAQTAVFSAVPSLRGAEYALS